MKKIFFLLLFSCLFLTGCGESGVVINSPTNTPVNEPVNAPASPIENINVNAPKVAPEPQEASQETPAAKVELFPVVSIVDGDTIKVDINGIVEIIRLIGIDTPEVVDPRKPVECFGVEASNKAKEILAGQSVRLEADPTQGDRDSYGRLLRYVFLSDGRNFNKLMIEQGYAHEYTYNLPYKYQTEFKQAENYARENKLGLWAPDACVQVTTPVDSGTTSGAGNCLIKGNISATTKEKIYHLPGCGSYDKTVIDESQGERWFCTEEEAVAAGWRKAKNCP